MDKASFIFCAASLAACLAIAAAAFPFTAKSKAEIEAARTVTSAEQFEDLDLGDFGTVAFLAVRSQRRLASRGPAPGPRTPPEL